MNQPDLFDVGDRDIHGENAVDSRGRRKMPRRLCIPAAIGSGPKGETCRSCAHYVRRGAGGGIYRKCGLMEKHWTNGAGTDIKAGWAACAKWEAK